MRDLLSLRESFSEDGILISFNGPFTHSIIEEIGNAVKHYLEGQLSDRGAVTDVFAVYIEQTQNVRNYLARRNLEGQSRNSAIVVISKAGGTYVVSSGNAIRKDDVPDLVTRLEEINSLDKDGLKRLYRERIRMERTPESTGAGVGLIDIARRARGKLDYSFRELDAGHDFFSLMVNVAGAER
jgi:hypothetical protein